MIEIKQLSKTYKPKKGVPVKALDNTSLKFDNKGMVFILGKSGSGKSTLLNVIGGLDGYDSGDLIIKGESSKNFKQSSFDSYRNTYVGFIFQEYNILDSFSVGANIALAIELQGRKAENDEINSILKEVDLEGYGDRKPNELSGGQLQRVAIARALVKRPEIIMADEPTGALDSNTGRQVFDTLKKLSKDKLVIIVSHDREFSEKYADRIIELKDGKVIDDVSLSNEVIEENAKKEITYSGKEIVVPVDYELTEEDRININKYIKELKNGAVLKANDPKSITNKKFKATNQDDIETSKEGFRLIKSKLSLKNAFRIGAGGLKHKRGRLVFTIILSVIAFTIFGVIDTIAAYNKVNTTVNSITDSDVAIDYAAYAKKIRKESSYSDEPYYSAVSMTDSDISEIEDLTGLNFKGLFSYDISLATNISKEMNYDDKTLCSDSVNGLVEFTQSDIEEFGYKLYGNLPDENKKEVAISEYTFSLFKEYGYKDSSENTFEIKEYEDILGKTIIIESEEYTITGVVDTNFQYDKFSALLKEDEDLTTGEAIVIYALSSELSTCLSYSLHNVLFVGNGFLTDFAEGRIDCIYEMADGNFIIEDYEYIKWVNQITDLSHFNGIYATITGDKITELKEDEIIVNIDLADSIFSDHDDEYDMTNINNKYSLKKIYKDRDGVDNVLRSFCSETVEGVNLYEELVNMAVDDYIISLSDDEIKQILKYFTIETDEITYENIIDLQEILTRETKYYVVSAEEKKIREGIFEILSKMYCDLLAEYKTDVINSYKLTKKLEPFNEDEIGTEYTFKIVGVAYSSSSPWDNYFIMQKELFESLVPAGYDGVYSSVVANMPESKEHVRKLVNLSEDETGLYKYEMYNSVTFEMDALDEVLVVIGKVFLFIGLGFALFACLMFSNFIGTSVNFKKKDIGILRAIGSRGADVFKIFFAESFIIAMINYVISILNTISLTILINNLIQQSVGLSLSPLSFSIRQVGILLVICLGVAAIATLLPVSRYARKKPIDTIRNR